MAARPRIDLDGVELTDPDRANAGVLAVFRKRTTEGLVVLIPESADFTVPWAHIGSASLDLGTGAIRVAFAPEWAATQNWLRGAKVLSGAWTDRFVMD